MLGEALAYDEDGWPTWRSAVIVAPRKNGKTVTLAALSLYRLLTSVGRLEILLAAPSDRVAGRLFDAAARFVRRSPELSKLVRVRDHARSAPQVFTITTAGEAAYRHDSILGKILDAGLDCDDVGARTGTLDLPPARGADARVVL